MSTQLLNRGFKIATAFINRYEFGKSLLYDKHSQIGAELDDTVSDIWYEDGIRKLTATLPRPKHKFWGAEERTSSGSLRFHGNHQWGILPWDYFVFFKTSRFVPGDVQSEMNYNTHELENNGVPVIVNDPRMATSGEKSWAYALTNAFVETSEIAVVFFVFVGLFFAERKRIQLMIRRSRLGNLLVRRKGLPVATKMID